MLRKRLEQRPFRPSQGIDLPHPSPPAASLFFFFFFLFRPLLFGKRDGPEGHKLVEQEGISECVAPSIPFPSPPSFSSSPASPFPYRRHTSKQRDREIQVEHHSFFSSFPTLLFVYLDHENTGREARLTGPGMAPLLPLSFPFTLPSGLRK